MIYLGPHPRTPQPVAATPGAAARPGRSESTPPSPGHPPLTPSAGLQTLVRGGHKDNRKSRSPAPPNEKNRTPNYVGRS